MGYRRSPRRLSPRARRNVRRHPDIARDARDAYRAMLSRCPGHIGGTTYPHGWEPAPPEVQDEVDDASAGQWHSAASARKAINRLRGWNAADPA